MAREHNIDWIQPLLESSNIESKDLKDKLYNTLLDKNLLHTNFQNNQKELAKYAFD